MKLKEIENSVETLSGVGPRLAGCFARLNIFKISDLLCAYPKDYEDRTVKSSLADFERVQKVHAICQVTSHDWFGYGKMKTLKVIITDGKANASLVCFNRPFMQNTLPVGAIVAVTAKFSFQYGQISSSSFDAEVLAREGNLQDFQSKPDPTAKVLAVYHLTEGLTQNQFRKAVNNALKMYAKGISSELPPDVIQTKNLMQKKDAIVAIHQGQSLSQIKEAIRTIKFEELYFFQQNILKNAMERRQSLQADTSLVDLSPRQKILLESLPFELTEDQKKIIARLNSEIESSIKTRLEAEKNPEIKPFTVAQLIQGDVGSGKTLVAFFAAMRIIDWGGQCCILAPTELLARQHAENAARILERCNVNVSFLTGNVTAKGRNQLLSSIKNGSTQLIVGTHALFSRNVQYANLQLAVVDEQHRFGVVQRNSIKEKCTIPNLIMMSATPIPQTLAQTVFGDLDVTTIKTMPKGRVPIKTHLTKAGNENLVYEAVRNELKNGHQAYFVYPMIESLDDEDSAKAKLKNATEMFERLSKTVFPEYKCALIHSKIDEEEQTRILEQFRKNDVKIVVATTVVEVGMDVPNATCMVIEQSERFGLAALHQLRGRVGRSNLQSHCFLIYGEKLTEIAKERLKAMYGTTDGFEIAELDLKLRGPGEVAGIQQSGFLSLGLSDPVNDRELMEEARQEVIKEMNVRL